jgi:hypothetical protein
MAPAASAPLVTKVGFCMDSKGQGVIDSERNAAMMSQTTGT